LIHRKSFVVVVVLVLDFFKCRLANKSIHTTTPFPGHPPDRIELEEGDDDEVNFCQELLTDSLTDPFPTTGYHALVPRLNADRNDLSGIRPSALAPAGHFYGLLLPRPFESLSGGGLI
jgi:hypothetical protein